MPSENFWNFPISIKNIKVKNRIVFPPIGTNWADSDGNITPRITKFYRELAKGDCGMIVVQATAITQEGKGSNLSMGLHSERQIEHFKALAEEIKKNNCFTSIQLSHAGGQANPEFTGHVPVSPSGVLCKATGFKSVELTIEEIRKIRDQFIHAAILAFKAGFQAVELHLAHGYLLHQFLSEYTNRRNDEYGGNIRKRIRLILEIIQGIREKAPDIIIGARISGEDYIENGINEKVNNEIIPALEDAGIEYFSVTAGIYDTSKLKHKAMKKGKFFEYARYVKALARKPVIGVGKILDLETAEKHLRNGDCDMVAIGRALIADPNMIKKARKNQSFTRCTECNECQYLRLGKKDLTCPLRKFDNE